MFIAGLPCEDGAAATHSEAEPVDTQEVVPFMTEWNLGGEFPVSPEVLDSFLQANATTSCDGVCSKMAAIRWDARKDILINEVSAVPAADQFCVRQSCSQRHPGLCCKKDAAIYGDVLRIASQLERYFSDDLLYGCYGLGGLYLSIEGPEVLVYFAHIRARRFNAQVTHVFVHINDGAEEEPEEHFHFGVEENGLLAYCTVWHVAKQLIASMGLGDIHVLRFDRIDSPNANSFALRFVGEAVSLSEAAHRVRKRKEPSDLDKLDKKPPAKRRANTGGIRYVAPDTGIGVPRHAASADGEDVELEDTEIFESFLHVLCFASACAFYLTIKCKAWPPDPAPIWWGHDIQPRSSTRGRCDAPRNSTSGRCEAP